MDSVLDLQFNNCKFNAPSLNSNLSINYFIFFSSEWCLKLQIVEGYGQTECVAPATLTVQGDYHPEHVGPPLASNAIKLVDVPEMDYFAAQGDILYHVLTEI